MLQISKKIVNKTVFSTKASGGPFYFPFLNNSVLPKVIRSRVGERRREPWWPKAGDWSSSDEEDIPREGGLACGVTG